jgi:hypothetical protein
MRMKRFSLLMLALVFIASLAVVGCGGGATFAVSNLVISPSPADAGSAVTMSALVTNSGSASGTYKVQLTVAGSEVSNQSVEVAAGGSTTATFTYTTSAAGTFAVSIGGQGSSQSGSLVVNEATGYWQIDYQAVEGSYILLNYSVLSAKAVKKVNYFNESDGIRFTMMINKSIVNGHREVKIPAATWTFPEFVVPDIQYGMDMNLLMPLDEDATGILYVEDGIGDVDMSSESTAGHSPIQVDTQGDGTKDPAGSMVIKLVLVGNFDVKSAGQKGELPFGLTFTTGHTENLVHITLNKKFDGTTIESNGVPFAENGGVADYVGTAGTLTTTGTGECLGISLVGMRIDFQTEIKLVLEPVD